MLKIQVLFLQLSINSLKLLVLDKQSALGSPVCIALKPILIQELGLFKSFFRNLFEKTLPIESVGARLTKV
jgi:hypothetical protein